MPVNILMPALSPTMEEGTLSRWLVKEGDSVSSGQILAEIETDKATMEFEAVDEGTIGKIVIPSGTEGVKVNDLIAVLLEEGETISDIPSTGSAAAALPADAKTPDADVVVASANGTAKGEPGARPDRVFASPLAKRVAAERGIDLSAVSGSGPNGRVVLSDVLSAAIRPQTIAAATSTPTPATEAKAPVASSASFDGIRRIYSDRSFVEVPLDGMRKTIAARLVEAKQTIPHFYLRRDIVLDPLLKFRSQINESLSGRGIKLSVNDFIIKASAVALQQVPDCNAVWAGDRVLRFERSDVAVAVAIQGGLFTPVIRDADLKSISAISGEMKSLAEKARSRKLAPHEYQGGSFAISNLGMMGIESFDAVINPPHASILAVGAGVTRPIVNANGAIEVATVMSVTLSVDHRVIDGALGAEFLAAFKDGMENPVGLVA